MTESDDTAMNDGNKKSRFRWSSLTYWVLAIAATVLGAGWYTQSARFNEDVGTLMQDNSDSELAALQVDFDDGSRSTVGDFKGRYLLLDFWASWCPYCRLSMPAFEALQQKYPQRLKVLAINTLEPVADARAYLKEQQLTLPLVQSSALVQQLQVKVLPTAVLLDPDGKRVWAAVGFVPLVTPALLEKAIAP